MSLTCECPYDDDGDAAWYWWGPQDFSILDTKRSRRCSSCDAPIKPGATVLKFRRTRAPRSEIEERIHGDDIQAVPMAPFHLCEACGDIFSGLEELEFCVSPVDSMPDMLAEYVEMQKMKGREL